MDYRFSHLICMFLKDVSENEPTECENTDERNLLEAEKDEVEKEDLL